jgi:GTP pyrophosphokinase
MVEESLNDYGIKFKLEGRVKTIYSIYKKMYKQNKSFDEIYDFYALRVLVDTELDCYTVLGIIHERFNSIPEGSRIIYPTRNRTCTALCIRRS